MATAVYRHEGASIDYTPTAAVAAGDVVVQGELIGIATVDIPASTLGALAVQGVFDIAKATGVGSAITAGADVYWDVAEAVAKTDDELAVNKLLGKSVAAAGDNDTTVRVRLNQ